MSWLIAAAVAKQNRENLGKLKGSRLKESLLPLLKGNRKRHTISDHKAASKDQLNKISEVIQRENRRNRVKSLIVLAVLGLIMLTALILII